MAKIDRAIRLARSILQDIALSNPHAVDPADPLGTRQRLGHLLDQGREVFQARMPVELHYIYEEAVEAFPSERSDLEITRPVIPAGEGGRIPVAKLLWWIFAALSLLSALKD